MVACAPRDGDINGPLYDNTGKVCSTVNNEQKWMLIGVAGAISIALLSLASLAFIRWHRRYTRRNVPTEVPARPLSAFVGTPGSLGGPRKSMMYWQSRASLNHSSSQFGDEAGPMATSGMGNRTDSMNSLTSRSYSDGQGYYGPAPGSPGLNGNPHPMAVHSYSTEYLPQSPRNPAISFAQPASPAQGGGGRNLPYPPTAALDNRYSSGGRELERTPSPEDHTPTRNNYNYHSDYERVPITLGSPVPVRTRIEQVEILQDESLAYLQQQQEKRRSGYGGQNGGGEGRYSEKRLSFIPVIEVNDMDGERMSEKRY